MAKKEEKEMGSLGFFVYILACILSFGMVWVLKLTIQKALIDSQRS